MCCSKGRYHDPSSTDVAACLGIAEDYSVSKSQRVSMSGVKNASRELSKASSQTYLRSNTFTLLTLYFSSSGSSTSSKSPLSIL